MWQKYGTLVLVILQSVQGQIMLGFKSECDFQTPSMLMEDTIAITKQAGQTVKKFNELVEKDNQLKLMLNASRFEGVILVPRSSSIIEYQLPPTEDLLVDQFKLFVIPVNSNKDKRESLQGSTVIMSNSIVANEDGESVEVLDIQRFGFKCQNVDASKFEVWIISDFLPLPQVDDAKSNIFPTRGRSSGAARFKMSKEPTDMDEVYPEPEIPKPQVLNGFQAQPQVPQVEPPLDQVPPSPELIGG
eukprot:TRINITY_DN2838_c0_g1_i4.p2 TRINITY_DN2838_c0_g1~~TRINITY_DN2838_c0_g1_i4.p2  ORF type:complete len:245 (-),score=15.77 TRINITY_DN2838_c0_g1_i4:367-1101(-)